MLEPLLYPKSVAVIGASRSPGKVGHDILANLIDCGYAGNIVPVNPLADRVRGIKCCENLRTCGIPIDLAVIAIPVPAVLAAVEDAIFAGAKAIALITAGFREASPEGAEIESRIAQICAAKKVRLLGPNCPGLINTGNSLNASIIPHFPHEGGISVISQSGAVCTAIMDWASRSHLGLAKMVGIGNRADLTEIDFLQAFSEDEQTRVIVGYLESISSGDEFVKVAETAASMKPVVILKAGTTRAGMKAASSHTGSLAGSDIAYGAAFNRSGVIRADSFEKLLDYAAAFATQPLPKGDRIAIISNAYGPGILAADAVEHCGLSLASPQRGSSTALRGKAPYSVTADNPIDVLGDADCDRYEDAVNAALDNEAVDAVIIILTPKVMTNCSETARVVAGCIRGNKPVLAAFIGSDAQLPGRSEMLNSNLPDYPSPERAVAALRALCEYASWRRRPPRVVTRFPVHRRRVERIIARQLRAGRTYVGEVKTKEILRAYGFTVPEGHMVMSASEAVEIANRMGYPVALKIVSPHIVHKSDIGGIKLRLSNPEDVRDACDLMLLRVRERMPDVELEGVYVEKMCPPGREVILGMNRDPQFGPMLMFGLGGIFVEVMKDVSFHLAPITAQEAMQMLSESRSYALLTGTRGQPGVDLGAIANGLQRISQLVTDFPQIQELDISPLIVGEIGTEPIVADARIILSKREARQ
ncbi:MAG: CoA-binding protein [Candidatus Abyssobacteria bacterium SURF_5]|uniref:CoA-binding protein n=1 Tax=Abyssobacteria bacterium (strain SURF_5) TaxID=2093360 RepID=A0A3A4NMR4_ABYX5|nr:MAG: CoA-binding protein [Candidatus Abyssubacteria bacterium SURF_5]